MAPREIDDRKRRQHAIDPVQEFGGDRPPQRHERHIEHLLIRGQAGFRHVRHGDDGEEAAVFDVVHRHG